jgi:cysteine desulfurase
VEHESILDTARSIEIEKDDVEVVVLPVDRQGIVKLDALQAALDERTVLVSIMYANNETGAIQPITKIAKAIADFRAQLPRPAANAANGPYPLFHTDAAQAFQFLDCRPSTLGVDLMTLSAHKIYGPKGVGALYVGNDTGSGAKTHRPSLSAYKLQATSYKLAPILSGGGQEFGLRSGTENVPLMVGFAAAVEYIEKDKEKHAKRIAMLKDQFVQGLRKIYPKAKLNSPKGALPHIANVRLPGRGAEDLLIRLDLAGMAVAAGSACAARSLQPSHVLRAMGYDQAGARENLRVSFGRTNTPAEVKKLLAAFKNILAA